MKITADREKCCSSGMCVVRAPDVFAQNDRDGVVEVLLSEVPAHRLESVRDAVAACPVQAITLQES